MIACSLHNSDKKHYLCNITLTNETYKNRINPATILAHMVLIIKRTIIEIPSSMEMQMLERSQ